MASAAIGFQVPDTQTVKDGTEYGRWPTSPAKTSMRLFISTSKQDGGTEDDTCGAACPMQIIALCGSHKNQFRRG